MGVKMALPTEQPNRRTWGKETYYTSFHFSHVINLSSLELVVKIKIEIRS